MQKCLFSKERKNLKNCRARVRLGFLSNDFLISKPKLLKISASLNIAASTPPFLWLTKFLSHLHKHYSHLVGSSCTKVISFPFHTLYDGNTELMSSCPWTSVNKTYLCVSVLYIVICLKCDIRHSHASPPLLSVNLAQ